MKFLKISLVVLTLMTTIFYGCKKEDGISFEGQSHGKLKDSIGNCLPMNLEGIYNAGTPLVTENFLDVHANIDSVGKYEILTDTLNGISFYGKGTLGKKGDNLIRLYGHGTPLSGGTYIYTVKYLTSRCRIAVKFTGTVVPPASYKLDTLGGVCSGAVLEGTFSTRIAATGANKATLKVNVTTAGTYSLSTIPVNGITFSGSGAFTTTGVQSIILTASGTPAVAGTFNHTASAGGVSCTFSVNVVEGPAAAVFALGGAPAGCTGFTMSGTYKAGTSLTSSNTVSCQVNITTAGAYSISTNTVNGISFNSSGTFATTGTQTVTLTGTGVPVSAGTNNFTATAGTSTCSFSVSVTGTTPATNNDYMPLSQNSWISYNEYLLGVVSPDTLKSIIAGGYTFGGNSYTNIYTYSWPEPVDLEIETYRMSGDNYYLRIPPDLLFEEMAMQVEANVDTMDILILKQNVATGTTWTETFNGTSQYSPLESAVGKYIFTVIDANATVTLNGVTYKNVIKINTKATVKIGLGTEQFIDESIDCYYAKGIGLINYKEYSASAGPGVVINETVIRNYKVY